MKEIILKEQYELLKKKMNRHIGTLKAEMQFMYSKRKDHANNWNDCKLLENVPFGAAYGAGGA